MSKTYSENKKALFNYEVLEKLQTGVVLNGQEVKSIRQGRINLQGAFVGIEKNEVFLKGAEIPPYQPNNTSQDYLPKRPRKLLLKKSEILYLTNKTAQKGLTIVPLRVYNANNLIKLEIAIVKGKKTSDKREAIKKREAEREIRGKLKRI